MCRNGQAQVTFKVKVVNSQVIFVFMLTIIKHMLNVVKLRVGNTGLTSKGQLDSNTI